MRHHFLVLFSWPRNNRVGVLEGGNAGKEAEHFSRYDNCHFRSVPQFRSPPRGPREICIPQPVSSCSPESPARKRGREMSKRTPAWRPSSPRPLPVAGKETAHIRSRPAPSRVRLREPVSCVGPELAEAGGAQGKGIRVALGPWEGP